MNPTQILAELDRRRIAVEVINGKIRYHAGPDLMTNELRNQMVAAKTELIGLIAERVEREKRESESPQPPQPPLATIDLQPLAGAELAELLRRNGWTLDMWRAASDRIELDRERSYGWPEWDCGRVGVRTGTGSTARHSLRVVTITTVEGKEGERVTLRPPAATTASAVLDSPQRSRFGVHAPERSTAGAIPNWWTENNQVARLHE